MATVFVLSVLEYYFRCERELYDIKDPEGFVVRFQTPLVSLLIYTKDSFYKKKYNYINIYI